LRRGDLSDPQVLGDRQVCEDAALFGNERDPLRAIDIISDREFLAG